jgi:hypothetical protein
MDIVLNFKDNRYLFWKLLTPLILFPNTKVPLAIDWQTVAFENAHGKQYYLLLVKPPA